MTDPRMLQTGYDPALVVLSIAIAILAAYTALDLGSRASASRSPTRWSWVTGAAIVMGGGIWSMHFVGMLAFEMGMPAAYDIGLTLLSLAIAIGATGAAFAWVSTWGTGSTTIMVSGALMGLGVAAMHYTGMAAMRMEGSAAYSAPIVALSVAIAVTAATVALWLSFRQHGVWEKVIAAFVMGGAVAGMHYTGMAAATFTAEHAGGGQAHAAALGASQVNLALSVAGATFVILFVAMLTSSVDQQRVQADLLRSEERFRAAVQAVQGVLWTNDADGKMVGEQPGWAAITGQSRAEYEGLGWANAVHPEDAQPTIDAWTDTVRERRMFVFEHRVRLRDGGWGHFAIRAVPVLDDAGEIREWVGVHTDITHQREAESELRESNEEVQRYAYIVSHDLRAPLVNVMGFASELASVQAEVNDALAGHPEQSRIHDDLGEALGFIKASVQRMERLIAAILKLSRDGRRSFRAETLDMVALVQQLADAQRHQFEAAGATIEISADLPALQGDRLAVEQILGNLIDNAVKYLDPNRAGKIRISARLTGGDMARFDVADNGRGIAPKDQARIFELFRRAGEQDQPGEGIGLAHVKSLARALGGKISVSSELGVGSTFSVTLPRDLSIRRSYATTVMTAAA